MTALEHNKLVGWAQLGYAAFHVLMLIVTYAFMGAMFATIFGDVQRIGGEPAPPFAFMAVIFVFAGLINILMTIPSIVAGYALLKRRPWAKIAGIIAGALSAMSFPIGTAVAVYTFWFLFSDAGKQVYELTKFTPPPPPASWADDRPSSL